MFKLIIFLAFLYSDTQNFTIQFWGINAAKVDFSINNLTYDNEPSKSITVKTEATNLAEYIFNFNNHYQTITSNDFQNIKSFSKETEQPGLINSITTSKINGQLIYNNSNTIIPSNYFNIFSLLSYLSNTRINKKTKMNLEREGLHYDAEVIPLEIINKNTVKYELKLIKKNDSNKSIINNTDIFTWALFKKNTKKYLTINYNNNQIMNCSFNTGIITMNAKNTNY